MRSNDIEQLRMEIKMLQRGIEELSVLNDLAKEIGALYDSNEIMQKIVQKALQIVHAEQSTITLIDTRHSDSSRTLVRVVSSSRKHEPFHLGQATLGWMLQNKQALLIDHPQQDKRFPGVRWEPSIQSVLCVPMMVKSEMIGALSVYNKKTGACFTENDKRILSIIATQSAQIIENARLYEKEKELIRIQEDLRLAARIQKELLPKRSPQMKGYDIFGMSIPATSVGGDFFDFIPITDTKITLCIGDVSGKGFPAAMLMSNVQATIRTQALIDPGPSICLQNSNVLLCRSTDSQQFITLFYGILDIHTHQLHYANAGHNRPILIRKSGETTELKTSNLVLSVVENTCYDDDSISFEPGDILVTFSDGITEAMNKNLELFGEERLVDILKQNRNASAEELVKLIITQVELHIGDYPLRDDMTLMVIKRLGPV